MLHMTENTTPLLMGEWNVRLLTSVPYGDLEMTSGAIQYGVPTKDFLLGMSLLIWAQKPKSESLTCNGREEDFTVKKEGRNGRREVGR